MVARLDSPPLRMRVLKTLREGLQMSEQQAAELLALFCEMAADIAAIRAAMDHALAAGLPVMPMA